MTLAAFLTELRKKHGWANAQMNDGIDDLALPPATFTNARIEEVMRWIAATTEGRARAVTVEPMRRGPPDNSTVFVISGRPKPNPTESRSSARVEQRTPAASAAASRPVQTADTRQLRTFALKTRPARNDVTAALDGKQLEQTVQSILNTGSNTTSNAAEIRYDPDTDMLIARGNANELAVVSQVVEEVTRSRRDATAVAKLQSDVDGLKVMRAELDRLRADIDDLKKKIVATKP